MLAWIRGMLPAVLVFVSALALWAVACRLGGFSATVLPGPARVGIGLWELIRDGTLLRHAVASLYRVTVGYYAAVVTAVPLGLILGRWRLGQQAFNALIQFLRPISPLAWIPLAVLWFGIGDRPAVFLIFLSSFFPILVATIAAVAQINQTYLMVASSFGFGRLETYSRIVFPAVLPAMLPSLRIGLGVAWLVVVAAEMIAVKSGLGFLILDSRNALRMDYVMAAMVAIGAIGIVLDKMVSQLGGMRSLAWATR